MTRVVHFELGLPDPDSAIGFYEQVFDWKIEKWSGPQEYWQVTTGDEGTAGINGGLARSHDGQPRTVNTIGVPSVDEYVERVTQAGGGVEMPKAAIPGVGWIAYCTDPQGMLFGIFRDDPEAK